MKTVKVSWLFELWYFNYFLNH